MIGNSILMLNCTNNFSTDEFGYNPTKKPNKSQNGANQLENYGHIRTPLYEQSAFLGQSGWNNSGILPLSRSVNTRNVNEAASARVSETGSTNVGTNNNVLQTPDILQSKQPKYPQYADKTARMDSFRHWPPGTTQTPGQMIQAGFYYTGQGDLVRCFSCGQGLKNWDPDDDPWIEHARFFPDCNHILINNGREFVQMVGEMFRETNGSGTTGQAVNGQTVGSPGKTKADTKLSLEGPTSPLLSTVAARSLVTNWYGEDVILKAINVYKLDKGSVDFSATDLLKIIFNLEDGTVNYDEIVTMVTELNEPAETELKTTIGEQQSQNNGVPDGKFESLKAKSLEEENRRLREQTQCKICLDEKLAIVFLPCGHLVCCTQCAPGLHQCPECHGTIKGSVKTLLT